MSQAGMVDFENANPQIPTSFETDQTLVTPGTGIAIPLANVLEILGSTVANATNAQPLFTTASGNTVTAQIQVGVAVTGAPTDKNDAGLVSFDDAIFTVSTHGYVSLVGGEIPTDTHTGDDAVAVPPDGAGNFNLNGEVVANATNSKPIFFDGDIGTNTQCLDIQVSTEITGAPGDKLDAGICSFDDTSFAVDVDGYVTIVGGGGVCIETNTGDDSVAIGPSVGGNFNWIGVTVANATHAKPAYFKDSATANAIDLDIQVATEITGAPGDKNDAGLSSYDDTMFSVDADGYVTLVASASFTTGSVIFWGASSFEEDNSNFFWDDTNNRLGIGTTTPLDTVHVVGSMDLVHVAAESDDHALELDVNAAGFGDVKALDINYVTGAMTAVQDEEAILLNIDESASLGGIINGYEVITTAEGSAVVNGYTTGINVNPIVHQSGTFGDADTILNKAVDVTAALASGGAGGISIFVADNDTFTIGDAATWDEHEIILSTGASGAGVAPLFEYSTGGAAYSSFSPADGTNGFRNTGAILWDSASLAGWATATSGEYEIRITRTRNSLSTTPVIEELQRSSTTEFKWDKNGDVNLNSLTLVVPLAATSGGTGQNLYAVGDILYADSTTTLTQLVVGSNTEVLTLAGGVPTWAAPTVGVVTSITGGPGITITGTAAVPIVNSVVYSDATASTLVSDSGTWATAAGAYVLPASPVIGELVEIVCITTGIIVTANTGQAIQIGGDASSTAGTATNSSKGDTLWLRYRAIDLIWYSLSTSGVWVLA